jgi:peptidoglycan hydrolase-like protein with peptidoglycan-binding domain
MRCWLRGAAAGGLVLLLAGGAAAVASRNGGDDGGDGGGAGTALAQVVSRDLVERETFPGTLGFDDAGTLVAAGAQGGGKGTLTALAAEGATVRRGGVLYRVDQRPVVLLYGSIPMYRQLADGVDDGEDVRQLEQNLRALGHTDGGDLTVDREFDDDTAQAVRDWQEGLGIEGDGVVEPGEVVFRPDAVRVGAHAAAVGSPVGAGAKLADLSSTRRVVTVDLDADRQRLVAGGDPVVVELADGTEVDGRIDEVGTVATAADSAGGQGGAAQESGDPTIEVVIALAGDDARRAGNLDQAPVDARITKEQRKDVLAVPVTALVALSEGGYAVEVDQAGARSFLRVEPGLFADGYVEVSGSGLRAGLQVVVPA